MFVKCSSYQVGHDPSLASHTGTLPTVVFFTSVGQTDTFTYSY